MLNIYFKKRNEKNKQRTESSISLPCTVATNSVELTSSAKEHESNLPSEREISSLLKQPDLNLNLNPELQLSNLANNKNMVEEEEEEDDEDD